MKRVFITVAALLMAAGGVSAHDFTVGDLVIAHPWARPSLGATPNGAAYMTITNNGTAPERLLSVHTPAAQRAELHATLMDGEIMRMRAVADGIEILPGQTVEIAPGGVHVMLMGLASPLKEGGVFPLGLQFEKAGDVEVEVHIESKPSPDAPPVREHQHNH